MKSHTFSLISILLLIIFLYIFFQYNKESSVTIPNSTGPY